MMSCFDDKYSSLKNKTDTEIFEIEIKWNEDYGAIKKEADIRRKRIEDAKPKYKCGDIIEFENIDFYGYKTRPEKCLIANVEGKLYLISMEYGNWWSQGISHVDPYIDVDNFGNDVLQKIIGSGKIDTVRIINN